MCGAKKGYGFLAVLVLNRASLSTILVGNRVWFVYSSLESGIFIRRISYFIIWRWDHFPSNVYANYRVRTILGGGGGVLSYKGLMGTCGQPRYVFRDFCLKQGIDFIIFCLKQGIFSWTIDSLCVCVFFVSEMGGHCARHSLRTPWKLSLRIVVW